MDFTFNIYEKLINSFVEANYEFQTFEQYLIHPKKKVVILRHDVDARKLNSLAFAKFQHKLGIQGSYYFRITPNSFNKKVIKDIYEMGHEIGYHYEDVDLAKGNIKLALEYFTKHLNKFRQFVPIKTICMHGSPYSKYDNKLLWKFNSYHNFNIIGEPYFDLDFQKVFYLTDTGRSWNGKKMSIRDKVNLAEHHPTFNHTNEIIAAIEKGTFPEVAMLNFHPQRWTNNTFQWLFELIAQNLKNQIKKRLVRKKYMHNKV